MNINVVLGLLAAVALVIAGAIFGDLVGRVMFGVGYLYCPAGGECWPIAAVRFVMLVAALVVAFVFVKLID